jgi:hypothetical protein
LGQKEYRCDGKKNGLRLPGGVADYAFPGAQNEKGRTIKKYFFNFALRLRKLYATKYLK